ncbi:MAG: LamG-like jellyroll fold domain-containing protein [Bacteroidia bacterium]|nr:LamG-like jellyroll fold domain-containing protein [Bacteroidia bacterium]
MITYRLPIVGTMLVFSALAAYAQSDTIFVQTFTFDDPSPVGFSAPYRGTFQFPDASQQYEKILMYYTLKCDPKTNQDNYPCGEWDYLTYTFVVDSSGTMDSTARSNANYSLFSGFTPDSLSYTTQPVYSYYKDLQSAVFYTDTLSLSNTTVGNGSVSLGYPFSAEAVVGRSQFLWKSTELNGAGLTQGNISGIKLNISAIGSEVRNFTLRLKHTLLDSLTEDNFEENGFTTVYHLNTLPGNSGWVNLNFIQPFNWDGLSNVVVDFTYENLQPGSSASVLSENVGFNAGIFASGNDYFLDFDGSSDIVNLGTGPQISGAAPRTIEAWAYTEAFNGGGLFHAGPTGTTGADFSFRTMGSANLWRFQMWGTPDFDVTLPGSLNSWHHYCVTFDGAVAKVYYDGQFVQQKTVSLNTGISEFRIGDWGGSRFNGKIDEFRIWDKALSASTIADWKNRTIDPSHPDYAHLVGYYPFDEGTGLVTQDESGNGYHGNLQGPPGWQRSAAENYSRNLKESPLRPNIIFEQGVFTSSLNSTVSIDSFENAPVQVILYENPSGSYIIPDNSPNHPSLPTDTVLIWEAGKYTFIYDVSGNKLDSLFISPENTFYRNDHRYFSNIVWYEIGRYITPYGINLDLGPGGTRWIFDVTDYAPLFHDQVYLQAGNNQELLDLQFVMIKGTPPRTVKKIENLWDGSFSYSSLFNDTQAKAVTKYLDPTASMWRIKTLTSGHGFGGNNTDNCAEFCPRDHHLSINGIPQFQWNLWKECGDNFVYPQGGTWVYDRAGWCPGAEVPFYDHELTPFVNPGDSVVIDYGIESPAPYVADGNYVLRGQLITYGSPNFSLEASIEEIFSPNSDKRFSRRNPVCANPKIIIRNNGSTPLTKLLITYGVKNGFMPCYFRWEGNLDFLESEEVELPLFNWTGLNQSNPIFYVALSDPNNGTDQNPDNDYREVPFEVTPQFINGMYLEVRTNGAARENSYSVKDVDGNVVFQRSGLTNYTVYRDTLDLASGCYVFHFRDDNYFNDFDGNDGISWWANNDGIGYARWHNSTGSIVKTYNPDFGSDIYEQFTIGYVIGQTFEGIICDPGTSVANPEPKGEINIYPNPTTGKFQLEIKLDRVEDVEIEILNTIGMRVFQNRYRQIQANTFTLNPALSEGIYMVKVRTVSGIFTRMIQIVN